MGGVCDVKFDGKLGVLLSFDYCVSGIYFTFLLSLFVYVLLFLHGLFSNTRIYNLIPAASQ